MRKIYFLILFLFGCMSFGYGQALTGIKTIPGTYSTLASAIADLNSKGVGSGGVVFNISAGYTETISTVLSITTRTSTSANRIVFKKSGTGANPLLSTGFVGIGTSASAVTDGMIRVIGTDYLKFDGIDLTDTNSVSNTTMMEYGFGLFKFVNLFPAVVDGCQFVEISNCRVTLNRRNTNTSTAPNVEGSACIAVYNSTPTASTTPLTSISSNSRHYMNYIANNYVTNSNYGIVAIGYQAPSPYNLADSGIVIRSNSVINYGGGGTANSAGIYINFNWGATIAQNIVNNNNGSGVTPTTTFKGIYSQAATGGSVNIDSNTVTILNSPSGSQTSAIENGIGGTPANNNTINIRYNSITGCYNPGELTTGALYGIYDLSVTATNVNISNNRIYGNNWIGTGTANFFPIYHTGIAGALNVTSNEIYQNVLGGTGTFSGLELTAATRVNSISNIVRDNKKTGASGSFFGLRASGVTNYVSRTQVYNDSISSPSGAVTFAGFTFTSSSGTGDTLINSRVNNILIDGSPSSITYVGATSSSSTNRYFLKDTVSNLNYTGTTAGAITGMVFASPSTFTVTKCRIHDLSANVNSTVTGISLTTTLSNTGEISNTMIGRLFTPTSTSISAVTGILMTTSSAAGTLNLYNNSIVLTGNNTASSGFVAQCLNLNTTINTNLRNNILYNTYTSSSSAAAFYLIRRSTATLTTYSSTSNKNLLYNGTPSAARLIYFDGTNSDQTLTAFKARVTPRDANSVTESLTFYNTSNASLSNWLEIDTTIATQVESGADSITTILDDQEDEIRAGKPGYVGVGTNFDIGADEFNGTPADLSPPTISTTVLTNTASVSNRTVTASITDVNSVALGSGKEPRIYFRKNSGTFFSQTYASRSGSNYQFQINYSLLGSVAAGDTIYYYLAAQDSAPALNSGTAPAGGSGTPPGTTAPSTFYSYRILPLLATGVYYVGTTATCGTPNYPTITAALNDYRTKGLNGPVTFVLNDNLYNTTSGETFPLNIYPNGDASASNRLTIQPCTGVSAKIQANLNNAVVRILGADYVTLDGINTGGSYLSVQNDTIAATNVGSGISVLDTVGGNGCVGVELKNLWAGGPYWSSAGMNYGVYIIGAPTNSAAAILSHRGVTLTGVSVSKTNFGIYAVGLSNSILDTGLVIQNCFAAPVNDSIFTTGIHVEKQFAPIVSNNYISGIIQTGTVSSEYAGLRIDNCKNAVVNANNINRIRYAGSSAAKNFGIINVSTSFTTAGNPSNNLFSNNLVYDFYSTTTATSSVGVAGISTSAGYGDKFYFNSVYLRNTLSNGSASAYHAAFANGNSSFATPANAIDIRNNIFAIAPTGSTSNNAYAHYVNGTGNYVGSTVDYNTYYDTAIATGNTAYLGYFGSTNISGISAWRTATGKDANSLNIDPVFLSNTNLIPNQTFINNTAVGTTGITNDFNGVTRSGTPDFGAIEFSPIPNEVEFVQISNTTFCSGTGAVSVTFKNNGTSPITSDSIYWEVNGVRQADTLWTGSLAPGLQTTAVIGTYNFPAGSPITIRAWSVKPNGFVDLNPYNDTTSRSYSGTSFAGVYTIGAGGNFSTIKGCTDSLILFGVCGPVDLYLLDTAYNLGTGNVSVTNILGTSATNRIVLRPTLPNTVIYTNLNTGASLWGFTGVDYFRVDGTIGSGDTTRNLTLKNYGTSVIVKFYDNSDFNTITNCYILGNGIQISTTASISGNDSNVISNNVVMGLFANVPASGIINAGQGMTGSLANFGNQILNNQVSNFSQYGINENTNCTNTLIYGNTIIGSPSNSASAGIFQGTIVDSTIIDANLIRLTGTAATSLRGINLSATRTTYLNIVRNNVIELYGNGVSVYTGIYNGVTTNAKVRIYFNTVSLTGANSGATVSYCYYRANADLSAVVNNIFSNTRTGGGNKFVIYLNNTTGTNLINYNNYYSQVGSGYVFGYYSANRVLFTDWKAVYPVDSNSTNLNPMFVTSPTLRTNNIQLINTGTNASSIVAVGRDISGKSRNATTPDIGAYEWNDTDLIIRSSFGDYSVTGTNRPVVSGTGWVYFYDGNNQAVMAINPNGNNLDSLGWGVRTTVGTPRSALSKLNWGTTTDTGYLVNRNFYIQPKNQPTSPVLVRQFYTGDELNGLMSYLITSKGQPMAGGFNDFFVTKFEENSRSPLDLDPTNNIMLPSVPDSQQVSKVAANLATYGTSNYLSSLTVNSFSEFYLGWTLDQDPIALPILIAQFSVKGQSENAILKWTTASEKNAAYFEVERSLDGITFSKVTIASAKGFASNYSYTDANAAKLGKVVYYRLKMVDFDGSFEYSEVKSVQFKSSGLGLVVYPNPATTNLFVEVSASGQKEVLLTSINGQVVKRISTSASGKIELNIEELPQGVYVLTVRANGSVEHVRIVH